MATLTVEREEEELEPRFDGALPPPRSLREPVQPDAPVLARNGSAVRGLRVLRPRFFEPTPVETAVWGRRSVEVLAKEGKLIVRADLPGLTKDDVKVGVTDGVLTLEGERKQEEEERTRRLFPVQSAATAHFIAPSRCLKV